MDVNAAGDELIAQKAKEPADGFPGQLYRIELAETDLRVQVLLVLPPEGVGECHMVFLDRMMSGMLKELAWTGGAFRSTLAIPNLGGATLSGTVDTATVAITGTLLEPDETEGSAFEGHRIN